MRNEDKIRGLCEVTMNECSTCNGEPDFDCIDCTQGGKAELARQILELLQQDNE